MNNALYLITGPSGAGKTALAGHLEAAGYTAIDADSVPGLCYFVNKNGKPVPYPAGADAAWWANHNYVWELDRLHRLLNTHAATQQPTFLCGNAGNINRAWDSFSQVFYLDLPKDLMIKRLAAEDRENSFGKRVEEQELLLGWVDGFKEDMLGRGAISIDATQPLPAVAADILARINAKPAREQAA